MIVAIDPGKVTGVARWNDWTGGFDSFEIEGRYEVYRWLDPMRDVDGVRTLVVEQYDITAETHKLSSQLDALYIIGAAEAAAQAQGLIFHLSPRYNKTFGSDAKLKHLGWYRPSKGGHQNDAARHLLAHLAAIRNPWVIARLKEMAS